MTPDAILRPALFAATPSILAGFTTRAFAGPDESREAVRARLSAQTGMPVASVAQVHGAEVVTVTEPGHRPDADGLVTSQPDLLLTVVAADCALVLLADAEAGVVGACHSGWRGTVGGIVGSTVAAMQALGADAASVRAYVGPCISAAAFEVGEEVAAAFPSESVLRRAGWPRPHVDLRADLRRQLAEAGVADDAIEVDDTCTVGEPSRLYSYRAEQGTTGRMVGFIGRRSAERVLT